MHMVHWRGVILFIIFRHVPIRPQLFENRITLFTGKAVTIQCSNRVSFDAFGEISAQANDSRRFVKITAFYRAVRPEYLPSSPAASYVLSTSEAKNLPLQTHLVITSFSNMFHLLDSS